MTQTSDDGVYHYAGTIYLTYMHGLKQKVMKVAGNPNCLHLEDADKLPEDAIPLLRPMSQREATASEYRTIAYWCFMGGHDDADKHFQQMAKHAECADELEELAEKLYQLFAGPGTTPFHNVTLAMKNRWLNTARRWQEMNV